MKTKTLLISCFLSGCVPDYSPVIPGTFSSNVVSVDLLDDGRNSRLLKDFSYLDGNGLLWHVPAGTVVDGATIPQLFWTLIGGPYEGHYRFASVLHDHYYRYPQGRTWEQVHRMFYEACIVGGTSETLAKLMYAAVYHFSDRWDEVNIGVKRISDWQRIRLEIERNPGITLEEIDQL